MVEFVRGAFSDVGPRTWGLRATGRERGGEWCNSVGCGRSVVNLHLVATGRRRRTQWAHLSEMHILSGVRLWRRPRLRYPRQSHPTHRCGRLTIRCASPHPPLRVWPPSAPAAPTPPRRLAAASLPLPPRVQDNEGYTPLHKAAFYNVPEAARLLVAADADVNAAKASGHATHRAPPSPRPRGASRAACVRSASEGVGEATVFFYLYKKRLVCPRYTHSGRRHTF